MAAPSSRLCLSHGTQYDVITTQGTRYVGYVFDKRRFAMMRDGDEVSFADAQYMRPSRERERVWYHIDRVFASSAPGKTTPGAPWVHPYRRAFLDAAIAPPVNDAADPLAAAFCHNKRKPNPHGVAALRVFDAAGGAPIDAPMLAVALGLDERAALRVIGRLTLDGVIVRCDAEPVARRLWKFVRATSGEEAGDVAA